jgi:rSAM/selenodomain-associated transferase 1
MVELADQYVVAVLTRAPSSGGKSRLFAALGRPSDPALLRALLLDTIDGVTTAGVRIVVAVTPPDANDDIFALKAEATSPFQIMGQPEGDLGARMAGTMRQLFDAGARRVALVGSDLPSISGAPIRDAFRLLEAEPGALVLGPALDGGYYLVAASRVPPIFDSIAWGSGDVLRQTREAARRAGLPVHLVEAVGDVDTVADLRRLGLQRLAGASSRTAAWARTNGIASMRGSVT